MTCLQQTNLQKPAEAKQEGKQKTLKRFGSLQLTCFVFSLPTIRDFDVLYHLFLPKHLLEPVKLRCVLIVQAAFRIFFPPAMVTLSAKDQGKQRLQMILVADRCGMSTAGLTQMKTSIVRAVSEFVDIETEELVDVSITHDDDMG